MALFNWKKKKDQVVDEIEGDIESSEVLEEAIESDESIDEVVAETEEIISEEVIEDLALETTEEVEEVIDELTEADEDISEEDAEEAPKKVGLFGRLKEGLSKTRNNIMDGVNQVFSGFSSIDEDFYEELEEALIMADMGVNTSMRIIEDIKGKVKERGIKEPEDVRALLKEELEEIMFVNDDAYDFIDKKSVVLVIGVNGVGKTTTIGKLSNQYREDGKKVVLAAADTFRAAAIDQLEEWAKRSKVDIIAGQENSDPGAIVYDAIASAKSKNADLLICDTAGRLQNKKNLMNELGKIFKIINKEYPEAHKEVLIVLDSTTGQNALQQAKVFNEIADVTGIVLTKLDGTAKGGIAIAIQEELKMPVKYIGVGEGIDDLQRFDPKAFVSALFD